MGSDSFGRKLRALRRQQGMTQTELAGAELSTSYVSLLETGKRKPTTEIALKLAARLNVAPDALLDVVTATQHPGADDVDDVDHRRAELLRMLARAERDLVDGSPQEALELFTRVRSEADGADCAALHGMARAAEFLGDLHQAVTCYAELVMTGPRSWDCADDWLDTVDGHCRCLCDLGRHGDAAAAVERAWSALAADHLEGTPVAAAVAATLAYVRLDQGSPPMAARAVERMGTADVELATAAGRFRSYGRAIDTADDEGDSARALTLGRRAARSFGPTVDGGYLSRLRVAAAIISVPGDLARVNDALAELELFDQGPTSARWRLLYAERLLQAKRPELVPAAVQSFDAGWPGRSAMVAARTRLLLARARWEAADLETSKAELGKAASALVELGAIRLGAGAYLELARLCETSRDEAGALSAYRIAAELGLTDRFGRSDVLEPETLGDLKLG